VFQRVHRMLRRLSVRNRLILSIFSASLIVVLVVGVMLVFLSTRTIRQQAEEGLTTTIAVLSQDFVKILLLDSPEVAADTVSKLRAFTDVQAAFLYDKKGVLRFAYREQGSEALPVPDYRLAGVRYHQGYLEMYSPLVLNKQEFGVVYLRLSLTGLQRRMLGFYQLVFVIVPLLIVLALIVAVRFQRSFSRPVSQLAEAFNRVNRDQYSVRLHTSEENEIGRLFDGFNRMLSHIETVNQDLVSTRQRLHVTLESISDGVVACDESNRVIYLNRSAEKMLQWRREEAEGRPVQEVAKTVREDDERQEVSPWQRALWEAREIAAEPNVLLINWSGEKIPVSVSASPMWDVSGAVIGTVMVIRDVTESHRLARELSYQATHDSLTGLVNRNEFERILKRELRTVRSRDDHVVLLYMDLDQFKVVNDTCGHLAGDQLLKQLAAILQEELRASDVLARLGGDEFGVLLVGCDVDKANGIAQNLLKTIAEFRFVWNNHTFNVGLSIGMVAGDKNSESVTDLLTAADVACYSAKDAGRNRVHLFRPDDADTQQRYNEVQWVSRIVRGLDENRFRLYRQNIVSLSEDRQPGEHFEILIRMLDEEGRIVPPGAFFPAAERFGVTPNIDRWVLRNTLAYLERNPDECELLKLCSINVSGHTLVDEHFLDFVEAELDKSGVPGHKLCFEITETAAIANLATARRFIARLKARGCRFALDDFGSGLSSFAYLKNLDVDFLKIDGMFVRDMATDPIDRSMVKSINEVGHVMGMQTIAEFVEDEVIRDELKALGVDFAQGYGIHKPEPVELNEAATVETLA
jgi:diguanylate cyclase (GGDEF)-like protein/PAS domain S-box-containing protein